MTAVNEDQEDLNPFRINSRREILSLLRNISERNQLVRLVLDSGVDTVVTSILEVDEDEDTMLLDCARTATLNDRVLSAKKLSFETMLDNIRILFSSADAHRCEYEDLPAFSVPLPAHLIRLQRREFYRVPTPVTTPVLCTVPVKKENDEIVQVVTSLYNISGGGVAIVDDQQLIDTTPGRIYEECRIELPGNPVTAALEVRNTLELSLPNGRTTHRIGCQFVDPSNGMVAAVQKFITKLERDRNARSTGLG